MRAIYASEKCSILRSFGGGVNERAKNQKVEKITELTDS